MAQSVTVGNGGNKTVTEITINAGAGNKFVTEGWVGTGSGNKQFFVGVPALSASAPTNAISSPGGTVAPASGGLSVTPSGGATPYSIVWTRTSGDTDIVINSATSFSVSWSVPSERDREADWGWTVTDDDSAQVSGSVNVVIQSNF